MTSFIRSLTMPGLLTLAILCHSPVASRADDKVAVKAAGTMTVEQLREMLDDLGYEPETRTRKDGSVYYDIKIARDGWTFPIQVMLSPSRQNVWLVSTFGKLPEPGKVNVRALENLLRANYVHSPAYFTLQSDRRLRFELAMSAANLKAVDFRLQVDEYVVRIRQTSSAWRAVAVPVDETAAAAK